MTRRGFEGRLTNVLTNVSKLITLDDQAFNTSNNQKFEQQYFETSVRIIFGMNIVELVSF